MLRTPSRIRTGIFLRKTLVSKIRKILGKILGSFENVGPEVYVIIVAYNIHESCIGCYNVDALFDG